MDMLLRPSVLANIVMDEWCNKAEQQLGEPADLYSYTHMSHPIWSSLWLCTALCSIVMHCNTMFELKYLECNLNHAMNCTAL